MKTKLPVDNSCSHPLALNIIRTNILNSNVYAAVVFVTCRGQQMPSVCWGISECKALLARDVEVLVWKLRGMFGLSIFF